MSCAKGADSGCALKPTASMRCYTAECGIQRQRKALKTKRFSKTAGCQGQQFCDYCNPLQLFYMFFYYNQIDAVSTESLAKKMLELHLSVVPAVSLGTCRPNPGLCGLAGIQFDKKVLHPTCTDPFRN